jgi:hypothetical protein
MKKCSISIIGLLFYCLYCNVINAAPIQVTCTYNILPTDNILEKIKNDKSITAYAIRNEYSNYPGFNYLQFIINDNKITVLSWNIIYDYQSSISATSIQINRYFNIKYFDTGSLESTYIISRTYGDISGTTYADKSFNPYFKEGDIMGFIKGTCEVRPLEF